MHKLTEKLKENLRGLHSRAEHAVLRDLSSNISDSVLYQYRKQRGVNLGSWFVLERWITDNPYHSAASPAQSDLDVARGSNARETLEAHWDNWIVEGDWAWIAERGMSAVRIPIGYYHLCGVDPSVLHGTQFRDFESVFSGAWVRILRAIETANRYGLGVLIDLHAAPGKQNSDSHAGTSEPAKFFSDKRSRKHTIDVLCILLKALTSHAQSHDPPLTNIIGIELLNEPHPSSDSDLRGWYASAIEALRDISPTMPLYLGECWRTDQYTSFVEKLPPSLTQSPIVLDHHLYRCFTSDDNKTPAPEHTRQLSDPSCHTPQTLARASEKLGRKGGGLIVGEWSGALNPGSLTGAPEEQGAYVRAQLGLYEKFCAGWFFWTYKKQWGGDTGWSLRDAVGAGVFPDRVGLRKKGEVRKDKERRVKARDEEKEKALDADYWKTEEHTRFWAQYPGKYEHWRFGDGFVKGWDAGYVFIDSSPSNDPYGRVTELGFKGAWARQTTQDHGKGYWEYEHGFVQGVDAATRDFQRSMG
ncbi:glycoside hydrolase superfamily [Lyophyllum atratum]|nr:glycoside hydrolase superfamily [Lyophyllum atratum]